MFVENRCLCTPQPQCFVHVMVGYPEVATLKHIFTFPCTISLMTLLYSCSRISCYVIFSMVCTLKNALFDFVNYKSFGFQFVMDEITLLRCNMILISIYIS